MIRFQKCKGFRLWKWGSYQIELWYCPQGEFIPPHVHPNVVSHIVYLAGRLLFTRENRTCEMRGMKLRFKPIRVAPNQSHSAIVTGRFGLFLNIEKWINGTQPSSAATDLTYVTNHSHPSHL